MDARQVSLARGWSCVSSNMEYNWRMATLNIKNLSDSLYKRLQRRAKLHHRSTAQEVTHILEEVLEQPVAISLLELRGLGKKEWAGIDPAKHVESERNEWD
jgi:hypothetical protein